MQMISLLPYTMDRAILTCIASFCLGIFISSFVFVSPLVSLLFIIVGLGIYAVEKISKGSTETEVILLIGFLLMFSMGTLRYSIKDFHEPIYPESEGVVISEPEERDNGTRFIFLSNNGERSLVSADIYSPIQYGDRITVKSEFKRPEAFDDFNYPAYLAKDDIYWVADFSKVEILSSGEGNPLKKVLYKIKRNFEERIKTILSEPYASLLSGLLLAGKDALPKDILEEFRRAGIIHMVVLSGYNITIIAEFFRKFFERIFLVSTKASTPWLPSLASVSGILFFVLMTGAEATVVRAAIMVLVVIGAKMLGRQYSATRALLLAATLMLIENPKILVFDPSFQLSFLATLALIYVVPIVEKYLKFIPEKFELKTIVATTIGTQLTVLPLLVYSVGDISLVSLPSNILVLLIIPYTMLLGFIATTISYVSVIAAMPFAYIANLLLSWILGVSHFFGGLSFSSLEIPHFAPIWLGVIYVLLITLVWRLRNFLRRSAN